MADSTAGTDTEWSWYDWTPGALIVSGGAAVGEAASSAGSTIGDAGRTFKDFGAGLKDTAGYGEEAAQKGYEDWKQQQMMKLYIGVGVAVVLAGGATYYIWKAQK